MTPDIDLRISTMVRAMEEVVMPAVDTHNGLAREQAALLVGQLKLLAAQWKHTEDYASVCIADLVKTLSGLIPLGGEETKNAAKVIETVPIRWGPPCR